MAFSSFPTVQVRLPAGQVNTSVLYLSASIRDRLDCSTEVNLSSVIVVADSNEIDNLVRSVIVSASSSASISGSTNSSLSQLLSSGNQNVVGQVITLLSQQFNQINTQALRTATNLGGILQTSAAVSPLGSRPELTVSNYVQGEVNSVNKRRYI